MEEDRALLDSRFALLLFLILLTGEGGAWLRLRLGGLVTEDNGDGEAAGAMDGPCNKDEDDDDKREAEAKAKGEGEDEDGDGDEDEDEDEAELGSLSICCTNCEKELVSSGTALHVLHKRQWILRSMKRRWYYTCCFCFWRKESSGLPSGLFLFS